MFRAGSPGDEGTVAYHGNNVDLRGAFDYETPPTGEMVMVSKIVSFRLMLCSHKILKPPSTK